MTDRQQKNEAQLAARTGEVKPLDLSNLLRHAFFEGFMIAGGSQEAAAEWWPEYDPETCPAYSRILSALSPAPEAQQEPHEVLHIYEGDGGVVVREIGNISTFGTLTPAVHAAFEAASDAEAQEAAE